MPKVSTSPIQNDEEMHAATEALMAYLDEHPNPSEQELAYIKAEGNRIDAYETAQGYGPTAENLGLPQA